MEVAMHKTFLCSIEVVDYYTDLYPRAIICVELSSA